jgi:hypothetical protein
MDKKDSIKLISKVKSFPNDQSLHLKSSLEINGRPFHSEFILDISELAKSCQSSGEVFIFTCGCGYPACAGIFDGIQIEHLTEAVVWRFNEPMKDDLDLSDEEWEAMKQPIELRFDPDDYLSTIIAGIKEMKVLVVSSDQPVDLPIYDFTLEQLFAIEPLVFSTRLNVPEKRLISPHIKIDAYNVFFLVGGIEYSLEELFLPTALVIAYKSWKSYAIFPNDETNLSAYLLYLQKGREFCHELKQYLGRDALIKLRYHPPLVYNSLAWEIIEVMK